MDEQYGGAVPPVLPPYPSAGAPMIGGVRPWGFWATVGFTVLIALSYLIAQMAVGVVYVVVLLALGGGRPDMHALQTDSLFLAICTIAGAPVAIGLSLLFAWLRKIHPRDYLGLHWPRLKSIVVWCVGFVVFLFALDLTADLMGVPPSNFMLDIFKDAGPLLLFAIIIAAPVAEEFLFRGFVFTGIQHSRLGGKAAIVLSSAPWAFIHIQYDIYGIAMVFLAGLFFGLVRLKTGSLWLCILLHALMNLIATVEMYFYLSSTKT